MCAPPHTNPIPAPPFLDLAVSLQQPAVRDATFACPQGQSQGLGGSPQLAAATKEDPPHLSNEAPGWEMQGYL